MKLFYLIIPHVIFLLVVSCGKSIRTDSRLDGAWVSNKEMTLSKIDRQAFPDEKFKYLQKNLGELQLVFKGDKSAIFLTSQPGYKPVFEKYKILDVRSNSVTIKTSRDIKATYYFADNCFYIKDASGWGYNEYFCKDKTKKTILDTAKEHLRQNKGN